jgi:transcriptional regulator with XRE-family HTH domain
MKLNTLKGKIIEKGLTQKELAKEMKLNPKTFNSKLNGKRNLNIGEFQYLIRRLNLDNKTIGKIINECEV